jgi:hypothetical protein
MAKPILVVSIKNANMETLKKAREHVPDYLHNEYHVFIFSTERDNDIKVFFEKDQIELNKEKLEELLALAKANDIS